MDLESNYKWVRVTSFRFNWDDLMGFSRLIEKFPSLYL